MNNQISSFIFEKLNAAGVATHFVEKLSDTEQLNKKGGNHSFGSRASQLYCWLLFKRFGVDEGIAFETPIVEFYYKMMIWMIPLSMTSM